MIEFFQRIISTLWKIDKMIDFINLINQHREWKSDATPSHGPDSEASPALSADSSDDRPDSGRVQPWLLTSSPAVPADKRNDGPDSGPSPAVAAASSTEGPDSGSSPAVTPDCS